MYLTNKDMNLLCDIENLLHEKLVQTNGIKEVFEGKESYYFDENDKDYELWVKYWNLKDEEILAIGDQNNDIALLEAGGIKVAMGNATKELKSIADYITNSVENDGFVKAIEKFVQL